VSGIHKEKPPERLDSESYAMLREKVLRRDGWKCQCCGVMSNLEIHHQQFRSQSGEDREENLITLCAPCHDIIHSKHKVQNAGCSGKARPRHTGRRL
jgi:5-methylcytosine-specific restriction endonuclease McrA